MWWLCDLIGDGSDAEGNQFRPALALHTDTWSSVVTEGVALVRAQHVAAFDSDDRIKPMRKAMLAQLGLVDEGEADDFEAPALARKLARRLLIRQALKADDFGLDLTVRLNTLPLTRIRNKLLAIQPRKPLDLSQISGTMTIGDALGLILPQIDLPLDPRPSAPGGTFTDAFTGVAPNVDLASHTPTGGGAWNRVDGSVDMARVDYTNDWLANTTTDATGALYQCTDQASANQYVQYVVKHANINAFICNRATDRSNYVGVRANGATSKTQVFKRVAGAFTQLGSDGATTVSVGNTIKLESSGNDHTAYLNGVSQVGPSTDAFNNTETRQGVNPRSSGSSDWLDDFEAGTLGGGAVFVPRLTLMGVGA